MSQRVGFEAEGAVAIELDDVIPGEKRWCLLSVPRERRRAVGNRRRDEHGRPKASLGENRKSVLPDVEEAVVERQGNGSRERLARVEEVDRGQDVDDPVRLSGQVVHLLGERTGRNGERVPTLADAVVEGD